MNKAVARLVTSDTFKRFFLARLEWLVRGWFFAAGMWAMVVLAWLFKGRPEIALGLIERVQG